MSQLIRYGRHALAGFLPVPGATRAVSYRGKGGDFPTDPDTTLAFNFARDQSLTDLVAGLTLTFTRSTAAWYYNASGVLTEAAVDEARFDHFPNGGASRGLLLEEERTNLFLNSDAPVTQDVTVAAATHSISMFGSGSVTLSGSMTGVVTEGNPITAAASAGTLTCTVAGGVDYAQVESGSGATSMIVTAGQPVTRAKEICTLTDMTWFNELASTIYVKATYISSAAGGRPYMIDDGTATDRYVSFFAGALTPSAQASLTFIYSNSGGAGTNIAGALSPVTAGTEYIYAAAIQNLDATHFGQGIEAGTPSSAPELPTADAMVALRIGSSDTGAMAVNMHVAEFAYANTRKDDAFLTVLTTP